MSNTDAQLRSDVATNEGRSEWGGWAVVAGLTLEVGLAIAKSLGLTIVAVDDWGAVVADSLIGLGVYAEIHFGRKASQGNADLRQRADERAAKLENEAANARRRVAEIELLTTPRRLTSDQFRVIAEVLRGYPTNVQMSHIANDTESYSYASDIKAALEAGGASVKLWPTDFNGHMVYGLYLVARAGDAGEADRLMRALAGAGLLVVKSPATSSLLRLHVAHKPPPNRP